MSRGLGVPRHVVRTILVVLSALVVVTGVSLSGSDAAPFTVAGGATFNNPKGGKAATYRILHKIEGAIDHTCQPSCPTHAPEKILISTYLMDRPIDYDKVRAANNRGASVQMLMDSTIISKKAKALIRDFGPPDKDGNGQVNALDGEDRNGDGVVNHADGGLPLPPQCDINDPGAVIPDPCAVQWSYAVECKDSCRGGRGNNHVKFYAFTQTGSSKNVVMVSSANINKGGATNGWNDMWTMVGNQDIFDFYARMHWDMAEDDPSNDCSQGTPQRCMYQQRDIGGVIHRFFPRANGPDPSMEELNAVRCAGGTDVKIAMFWWSKSRGMDLARKVISLDRNGCNVQVIYGAPSSDVSKLLRDSAHRGGIELWDSRSRKGSDGRPTLRVHHKYMIVHGGYAGFGDDGVTSPAGNWKVFAGTQNWINGALRQSDENTIELSTQNAYQAYSSEFASIKKYFRRINN